MLMRRDVRVAFAVESTFDMRGNDEGGRAVRVRQDAPLPGPQPAFGSGDAGSGCLPSMPEAVVAMLATAGIGAICRSSATEHRAFVRSGGSG